jgi:hypothetical protein
MTVVFVSTHFARTYGHEVAALGAELGAVFELLLLPADPRATALA